MAFSPARGLPQDAALALFERVLALHGPRLSHLRPLLADAGLSGAVLVPRRSRAHR